MKIEECACGEQPLLEKVCCSEQILWRIRCCCGQVSKSFVEGQDGTEEECKDKAIAFWDFS